MNNNTFVHKYLKSLINKEDICVDMTCGNGNDTLFLANLAKETYAFDISSEAICNTAKRLKDHDDVIIIQDSHVNVDKYLKTEAKVFIFNLGYLPYGKEESLTKGQDTLVAFKKAYDLLKADGYIAITFYLGQKGGKEEYYLLDSYIKENRLQVLETYHQYKINSPISYIIKKTQSKHSL